MCLTCHLSTDLLLPDIPFREEQREFNLQRTDERPEGLRRRFVYDCGSRLGCGCGFMAPVDGLPDFVWERTRKEFAAGPLSERTALLWWDSRNAPPENPEELEEFWTETMLAHQDQKGLYEQIFRILAQGADCEVRICWAGDEWRTPDFTEDLVLSPLPDGSFPDDALKLNFRTTHQPDDPPLPDADFIDCVRLYRICASAAPGRP